MYEDYNVVVFFGPPYAGKSAYFNYNLRVTHHRVSAAELFKQNPAFGLRQVILQVASYLRDGKKVVIDDENWAKATRTSYIRLLSSKFPDCRFLCLKFTPQELVPYWSLEWALAEKVLQHDLAVRPNDLKNAEAKMDCWYGTSMDDNVGCKLEEPSPTEGLDLKDVKSKLLVVTDYKFEVPALFIQWQAITVASSDDDMQCQAGTIDVINCWVNFNPCGRVIIVMDGNRSDTANSESSDEPSSNAFKPLLRSLCEKVSVPVYIFELQTSKCTNSNRQFSCPPQPGILAFLQRLHHLHLFHRYTLYLHCTQDHSKMVEEAGVRHTPAKNVLHNPQMVIQPRCTTRVAAKAELKDIEFKEREGQKTLPKIPLYEEAKECILQSDGCGYIEESLPWGYMHGICFKDKDIVNRVGLMFFELPCLSDVNIAFRPTIVRQTKRYQQLYAETASHILEPGSKMVSQPFTTEKKSELLQTSSAVQSSTGSVEKTVGSHPSNPQVTELPLWLQPKSHRVKKTSHGDSQCVSAPSLESFLVEAVTARGTKRSCSAQPSTVYCMNVLELLETARLVLQESGDSDALIMTAMRNSASSSVKMSKSHTPASSHTSTNDSIPKIDGHPSSPFPTKESPNKSNMTNRTRALDNKPVDIISDGPPPKKCSSPQLAESELSEDGSTCMTSTLKVQQNYLVPNTVTTVPETELFQASSEPIEKVFHAGECPQGSSGGAKNNATQDRKRVKMTKSGPDLSFLDDIF